MKTPEWMGVMVALLVGIGAWGCGDNDNNAPEAQSSAKLQCEVMGTLCHDADTDAGQACHELGHDGTPAQCVGQFPACIETCVGDAGHDSDPFCRALGRLCHDTTDAAGQACHELGHENDPDACRREFDACAELCLSGGRAFSG